MMFFALSQVIFNTHPLHLLDRFMSYVISYMKNVYYYSPYYYVTHSFYN